MSDEFNNTTPRPTTVRGTVANHYDPLDISAAFATSGSSITWDLLSSAIAEVTLSADMKMESPANIERSVGNIVTLCVKQDGTGSRKLSWGAAFDWTDAGEPILAQGPGSRTVIQFYITADFFLLGSVFYKTPENDQPQTL